MDAPVVSLDTPAPARTVSEWAAQAVSFPLSPKQIEILDSPAHRLILCCSRQWGKSTVVALKALYTAIHQPLSRILVLSRSLNQSAVIVSKAAEFAAHRAVSTRKIPNKPFSVQLDNRSQIFAVPHSPLTSRGYTADILIVDEAAVVKDDVLAAALPAAAATNGKLWMLSTPNGETGVFYTLWHGKDNGWTKVRSTADECPQISREFLDEQRRLFSHTFRQEFYCEFTPPAGRLLTRERIERMVDPSYDHLHRQF